MFLPEVNSPLFEGPCSPTGNVAVLGHICFTWQVPLSPPSSSAHSIFSGSCGMCSKHLSLLMSFIRAFCSTWDADSSAAKQQVRREGLANPEELVRVKALLETFGTALK